MSIHERGKLPQGPLVKDYEFFNGRRRIDLLPSGRGDWLA
jgi:hypothetical protein